MDESFLKKRILRASKRAEKDFRNHIKRSNLQIVQRSEIKPTGSHTDMSP